MDSERVSFTRMADGTREDYELLERYEQSFIAALPDRVLAEMRQLGGGLEGYKIDRLQHSLQSATRAYRDDRDEEYVVMALLHDIGDLVAPCNHGDIVAGILKPYVSERVHWIARHHPAFQAYYYAHHVGGDRHVREQFRDSPYYDDTVEFCEKYDQNCFDPDYENLPLDFFEPMVRRVLTRQPFAADRG